MSKSRPDVPASLARIVTRCLEKKPEQRYDGAGALLRDLRACREELDLPAPVPLWRRPALLAVAAVLLLALAAAGFALQRLARERSARRQLGQVETVREAQGRFAAYALARRIQPVLARDPEFERVWRALTLPVDVRTEPAGAEAFLKPYGQPDVPWEHVGRTPARRRHRAVRFPALAVREGRIRAARGDLRLPRPAGVPARAEGHGAARHGSRPRRPPRRRRPADRAARHLARRLRGDEPPVQGVRRQGRIPRPALLARPVREGRAHARLGAGDGLLPRLDRPSGPVHVGARQLSRRARPTCRSGA